MDEEDKKEFLVKEWIRKAERDLDTAHLTLDNKPAYTDIICYHCQQAVEKYLKAYLVHLRQAQGDIVMVGLSNHQGDNLPIPNEKEPENRNPYFN
jgi:hypothetical protein